MLLTAQRLSTSPIVAASAPPNYSAPHSYRAPSSKLEQVEGLALQPDKTETIPKSGGKKNQKAEGPKAPEKPNTRKH